MNHIFQNTMLSGLLLFSVSCRHSDDAHTKVREHPHESREKHGSHGDETQAEDAHSPHKDESEHHHGKTSDLDRPVAELFDARCEHDIRTYQCDECRYEVGVVKADRALFEDGLLTSASPEVKPVLEPLRLTGEIQFDERRVAHISAQVDGIIRKVHVTQGDFVKKGEALFEIDSVEIGQAKAAFKEALATEDLAEKNNARLTTLRNEGIASEKEVLAAKQALDAAKIRTSATRGMLHRLGVRRMKQGTSNRSNASGILVLRAPSDGTILAMHAVSGEVIQANSPLITIGDNQSLWVWADLYERDFAAVRNQPADTTINAAIHVGAFPNDVFNGSLDFISPSMDETSRTIKARINVPNPDGKLLAGMFAEIDLFLKGNRTALSVPTGAILEDEGDRFVFVHHKDAFYVRRRVTSKGSDNGWTAVDGLSGKERIVTNGAFLLKSDVLRAKMGAGCAD